MRVTKAFCAKRHNLRANPAAPCAQSGAGAPVPPGSGIMFAYVLTFIACLGTGSDRCHSVELPWDGTLMQCMLFGQHAAAQWTSEHPGWALQRGWRCESGRSV